MVRALAQGERKPIPRSSGSEAEKHRLAGGFFEGLIRTER